MFQGTIIPATPPPKVAGFGFTVNVWPCPQDQGKNVRVLAELLVQLGAYYKLSANYHPGWLGADIWLSLASAADLGALAVLRIIDWAPESGEPWGGDSDNMITIQCEEDQTVEEAAEWIVGFLKANGRDAASWEMVDFDGSADITCPSLFVSCKINVLPAR